MKDYRGFRLYLGTSGWGWKMYGISYKTLWFIGFSIQEIAALSQQERKGGGEV